MSKRFPARPDLDQYKKQAKELLTAIRKGDSEALERLRKFHPRNIDPGAAVLADAAGARPRARLRELAEVQAARRGCGRRRASIVGRTVGEVTAFVEAVRDQISDASLVSASVTDFAYFFMIPLIFSVSASTSTCAIASFGKNKNSKMTSIASADARRFLFPPESHPLFQVQEKYFRDAGRYSGRRPPSRIWGTISGCISTEKAGA